MYLLFFFVTDNDSESQSVTIQMDRKGSEWTHSSWWVVSVHHLTAVCCYITLEKNIHTYIHTYICLTCSFLLLCTSDRSTALQLLSSWTACLSWALSSVLTLWTWAWASTSLTHCVSCRSLCSRSSSRPASIPWWDKEKQLRKKKEATCLNIHGITKLERGLLV